MRHRPISTMTSLLAAAVIAPVLHAGPPVAPVAERFALAAPAPAVSLLSPDLVGPQAAAPAPGDDSPPAETEPAPRRPSPAGRYFRVAGLLVDPQNDATLRAGGGSVDVDSGAGVSFGAGYRFPDRPLAVEVEYAYRRFETDDYLDPGTGFLGDSRYSSHTIVGNVLFDQPDVVGPVGVYAGVGLGIRISEFRLSTTGGGNTTEVNGDGFFWQAMAGVTVTLDRSFQVYGGVRWSDAGRVTNDAIRIDTESVDLEIGVRFYF